jgi:uncharacterized protein YbjT (DUF2867 family)
MKVLMIGATGEYAGLVLPELKERGATVRALIHNKHGETVARERGADETVLGDLTDVSSLTSAAKGMEAVFHIIPAFAPDETLLGTNMVEAAKAAGVRKIVFSGVIHPSLRQLANHTAKLAVEQAVYTSGMTYTVLQPAIFMQNIEGAWSQIVQTKRFALPYSKEKKACYVDYRDVAESAAIALTSDKLDNGTFELSSPGMLNRIEVAQLMSEAAGMNVEAIDIPFNEWTQRAQIPEGSLREGLRLMFAEYDTHGLSGGNPLVLRAILDREPRTFRQYITELAIAKRKAA